MTRTPAPPVDSRALTPATSPSRDRAAAENFLTIQETIRASGGAEAKMIRAMFDGNKALMDRFLGVAFASLADQSDLLANADPMTVIQAIKDSAALGLEPLTDEASIVLYKNKAQLIPGWRGYLKRIRNSGLVQDIDCQVVYENDHFELALGTSPQIVHIPARIVRDDDGNVTSDRGGFYGVYAWARMASGQMVIEFMEEAEVNAIRDRYGPRDKSGNLTGPWITNYGEMSRKTVLRRFGKRLPQAAISAHGVSLLALDQKADEATTSIRVAAAEARGELEGIQRMAITAARQTASEALGADELAEGQSDTTAGENEAQRPSEAVTGGTDDDAETQRQRYRTPADG
jgi:phage RecT family recombinase